MGKVIIRYWNKYQVNTCLIQHISLQTTERYFSFLPDSKEKNVKNLFNAIKTNGKHSTLESDISISVPDNELIIDLDSASINQAIDFLQSIQMSWQFWYKKIEYGFNSATSVLLLLKIGGLAKGINQYKSGYLNNHGEYKDKTLHGLFNDIPLKIEHDFANFSRNINLDISPEAVYTLAELLEIIQKENLNQKNKYLLGASAVIGGIAGGLVAGPAGGILAASLISGITRYSQSKSMEKDEDNEEILNTSSKCSIS